MTDKEIIINGVNVAGCEFRFRDFGCDCMSSNNKVKVLTESTRCADNHYCYYKQLRRKEQECKGLKRALKDRNIVAIVEEHEKLKKECEELKAATLTLGKGLNFRQDKLDRYKQALEKIGEIAKDLAQTKIPFCQIEEEIRNIINEVKDE